jgi:hypothetical protein
MCEHVYVIADTLTDALVKQFPGKFYDWQPSRAVVARDDSEKSTQRNSGFA